MPLKIVLAFFVASTLSASAATIQLAATIDSTLNGTGSPGTGAAMATLDDVTGVINITGTFTGLNGTTTNAHVHGLTATPNSGNAGVLFGLSFDSGVSSGTFSGSDTLTAAEVAAVIAGRSYVNIHSSTNGGGEIRGYLNQIPEPGSASLVALATGALLLRRRRK